MDCKYSLQTGQIGNMTPSCMVTQPPVCALLALKQFERQPSKRSNLLQQKSPVLSQNMRSFTFEKCICLKSEIHKVKCKKYIYPKIKVDL